MKLKSRGENPGIGMVQTLLVSVHYGKWKYSVLLQVPMKISFPKAKILKQAKYYWK